MCTKMPQMKRISKSALFTEKLDPQPNKHDFQPINILVQPYTVPDKSTLPPFPIKNVCGFAFLFSPS